MVTKENELHCHVSYLSLACIICRTGAIRQKSCHDFVLDTYISDELNEMLVCVSMPYPYQVILSAEMRSIIIYKTNNFVSSLISLTAFLNPGKITAPSSQSLPTMFPTHVLKPSTKGQLWLDKPRSTTPTAGVTSPKVAALPHHRQYPVRVGASAQTAHCQP